MQVCVIPVKEFTNAKERLSGLLSPAERERLALAMYQDVLDAVLPTAPWSRILVISTNRTALDIAERRGVAVFEEPDQRGQSASVERAAQLTLQRGGTALLSLPIDVPLITAADVEALWRQFQGLQRAHPPNARLAVMTPSRDALGTNALLRCPPDNLPCRFGHDSLTKHLAEAAAHGVTCQLYENPRLALDIDTPEDLTAFLSYRRMGGVREAGGRSDAVDDAVAATRAYRELQAMNIFARVS